MTPPHQIKHAKVADLGFPQILAASNTKESCLWPPSQIEDNLYASRAGVTSIIASRIKTEYAVWLNESTVSQGRPQGGKPCSRAAPGALECPGAIPGMTQKALSTGMRPQTCKGTCTCMQTHLRHGVSTQLKGMHVPACILPTWSKASSESLTVTVPSSSQRRPSSLSPSPPEEGV